MNYEDYIRQSLYLQRLPAYQSDIPFIRQLLNEISQTGAALHSFSDLNMETPITVMDKELMV